MMPQAILGRQTTGQTRNIGGQMYQQYGSTWMPMGQPAPQQQPQFFGYNRSGAPVSSPNDVERYSGSTMHSAAASNMIGDRIRAQIAAMKAPQTLHTAGDNARLIGDDGNQGVGGNPGANPSFPGGGLQLPEGGGGSGLGGGNTTPGGGGLGGGGQETTPLPPNTPGGYGSNPGSPEFGNIQTSITPTEIYTQQQTQRAINQRRAMASQAASLPWLLQQTARQGVSQRSPSQYGRVLPQVGMMQSEIARAPVEQQFADDAANMDHYRAGQVSREQEAQGLAGALLRMQDMNRVLQGTQGSILSGLLSRFG